MYKIKLEVNQETIRSQDEDLVKAIKNLKRPEKIIKTRGVITIKCGKKEFSKSLTVPRVNALYNKTTDIYREVAAKNFKLFLQ